MIPNYKYDPDQIMMHRLENVVIWAGLIVAGLIYLENPAYIKPGVIQEVEIIIARLDPKNQTK